MPFSFDPEVLNEVGLAEFEVFAPLDFSGLADPVPPQPPHEDSHQIPDPLLYRAYLDALMDLHLLVDEHRFHALLALGFLRDYRVKLDRGEAEPVDLGQDSEVLLPMPAETIVVMLNYAREPPGPDQLISNPHQQISGARTLSRWFGAQLIDGALFRGIAACHRLGILLHCRAGRSFETLSGGRTRAPGFTARALAGLDEHYHGCEEWDELKQLPTDPLFEFIKDEPNGFTHRRRSPAELHGEPPIVYGFTGPGEEETVGVIDAQAHYAFLPAFYNHVLRRALGWTRSVIAAAAEGDQA